MNHVAILSLIMIGVGAFSGLTSAMWATDGDIKGNWLRHMLIGIVATATVPLFLSTIQSDLIRQSKGTDGLPTAYEPTQYLVFAGFCALVAFYAPTYLKRLSDRILQQLEDTKKQVQKNRAELEQTIIKAGHAQKEAKMARQEVKPLIDKELEPPDQTEVEPE